jgi:hypothetical protein
VWCFRFCACVHAICMPMTTVFPPSMACLCCVYIKLDSARVFMSSMCPNDLTYPHVHNDSFFFPRNNAKYKFLNQNAPVRGLFSAFSYKYPQILLFLVEAKETVIMQMRVVIGNRDTVTNVMHVLCMHETRLCAFLSAAQGTFGNIP